MRVRPEPQHDDVEPTGLRDRRLVRRAHGLEVGRVHREGPAARGVHAGPRQELRAHLPPEIAVGRRGRAQLVDRKDPHLCIVHGVTRLQRGHARVHPPGRAAGRDGHREIGPRADTLPEEVRGDLGQLVGVAGDQDLHGRQCSRGCVVGA